MPLILIDAHYSRIQIPLFDYVNYERKRWKDFIGIPNKIGTLQIGNSPQNNVFYNKKINTYIVMLTNFKERHY